MRPSLPENTHQRMAQSTKLARQAALRHRDTKQPACGRAVRGIATTARASRSARRHPAPMSDTLPAKCIGVRADTLPLIERVNRRHVVFTEFKVVQVSVR